MSPYLCGFRKGFSTQHALIALIEKWKSSLDQKGYAGSILMDLSKAFDTIDSLLAIEWFDSNYMKLNEEKCHFIVAGHKYEHIWANVGQTMIWEQNKVKLFGVTRNFFLMIT